MSLDKFLKVIDDVTTFIVGDKRSGSDRRVKKSKRKTTRRKQLVGKKLINENQDCLTYLSKT